MAQGARQKNSIHLTSVFGLEPCALRLAPFISCGFRSLHSCGAAVESHHLPIYPSDAAFRNLLFEWPEIKRSG